MQFPQTIIRQLIIYGAADNLPDVTIGPGPDIKFYSGTDVVIQLSATGSTGFPTIVVQDPSGDSITLSLYVGIPAQRFAIAGNSGFAQFDFAEWQTNKDAFHITMTGENADTVLLILREDASGFGEIVVNQEIVAADPSAGNVDPASETWHDVSFQAGWANIGAPFANVQYRLMPDGTVLMRGIASAGTKVDGTVIFQLPAGYRPPFETAINVVTDVGGNTPEIQITTGGNAKVFRVGTGNIVGFDGYRFPLGVI